MRTLLRGAIAAVALSLAPVAVVTTTTASASAAVPVDVKTSFQNDVRKRGVYNGTFIVSGAVETVNDPDGFGPLAGIAYLQRMAPKSNTWKNVGSDDSPGFAYFPNYDTYKGNAKFRIFYTGGTYNPGASSERTYPASVSKVINVKVSRVVQDKDISKRKPAVQVKFSPNFAKKKVLVQKKSGKKGYKTFRKVRANKKGQVRVAVNGSSKGTKYRLVAPGDRNFVATQYAFTAFTYRSLNKQTARITR